ncbi:MAG: LacI family transcriptional regulator [Rhizobiales bacterium]|nr:LacI family transcriptional regulator [Hyphomicrobiales bacterium]
MMDVAMAAGVSQTTVSLVLNRVSEARLSAETRTRVYTAAEALGYAFSRRGAGRPEAHGAPVICFAPMNIPAIPGARSPWTGCGKRRSSTASRSSRSWRAAMTAWRRRSASRSRASGRRR